MTQQGTDPRDDDRDATPPAPTPEEAIRRIAAGADPGTEAFAVSNSFTDAATARFAAAVRRLLGR